MQHPHICFGIVSIFLFLCEILIALCFHNNFIRFHFGDILVVILLYALLRTILPVSIWKKMHTRTISLWIPILMLFSVIVECMQALHIVELLGLSSNSTASLIIGTSFDWVDLLCYFSGCIVLCLLEWIENRFLNKFLDSDEKVK